MTPERWGRLKELYSAADDLDADRRETFLARISDPELVSTLRKMLESGSRTGFLDRPVWEHDVDGVPLRALSPGDHLCERFQIVRFIARGGMGEVYEAYDSELRERVALKTVRASMDSDPAAVERFRREVRRARAINSRYVCRVHDLFTHRDGKDSDPLSFLTMRLLEGETLQARIDTGGPFRASEALPLLRQIAEGIDAAHRDGIVHGDLKSANVMLTASEGGELSACITDFGLAQRIPETASESQTEISGGGGTPQWLAPEQVSGAPASRESDVYAFGLIAYHMVTGRLPFDGATAGEQMRRRVAGAPHPARRFAPDLSPRWDDALSRCLSRDPALRYRNCAAVLDSIETPRTLLRRRLLPAAAAVLCASVSVAVALEWHPLSRWFATAFRTGRSVHSVAVLPFQRIGPTPEYFSDGFTEELMHSLAQIRGLRVLGPESSFQFKNSKLSPQELGGKLGVRYLLMGSVRRVDSQIRVIARLIDAEDGSQVWSQDVTRSESQLFLIRDALARMLAGELNVNLAAMQVPAQTIDPTGLSARDLYWTGRLYFRQRTDEGVRAALQYFQNAAARDPRFALAYCGLADALFVVAERALMPPADALAQAEKAAREAVQIDPSLPEAWTSLAQVSSIYEHNMDEAERYFRRALELNPQFSPAAQWYAYQLVKQRRFREATAQAEAAVADDPLSQAANINLAVVYLYSGQDDRATQQCRKLTQMDPQLFFEHPMMAIVFARRGLTSEALHEMELIPPEKQDHRITLRCWVEVYALAGMRGEAQEALKRLLDAYRKSGVPASYVAAGYAAMGDKDLALEWLGKALELKDAFASVANAYPAFDSVRADPRFQGLMAKLGIRTRTP